MTTKSGPVEPKGEAERSSQSLASPRPETKKSGKEAQDVSTSLDQGLGQSFLLLLLKLCALENGLCVVEPVHFLRAFLCARLEIRRHEVASRRDRFQEIDVCLHRILVRLPRFFLRSDARLVGRNHLLEVRLRALQQVDVNVGISKHF